MPRDYLFTSMPPVAMCHMFCQGVKDDRNLIVVDSIHHVIIKAHKGNHDECNNALFSTYALHKQNFPCPVKVSAHDINHWSATPSFNKISQIFY